MYTFMHSVCVYVCVFERDWSCICIKNVSYQNYILVKNCLNNFALKTFRTSKLSNKFRNLNKI